MFSSTTIELSTIMPTPIAMPPSDIIFRVMPVTCMMRKTETIQIGIEIEMTAVAPRSRRKANRTMAASRTPKTIF